MSEIIAESKDEQSFCFSWSNYENHLSSVVQQLHNDGCMADVTLSVSGERIHAHRMVLCACSGLFQEILKDAPEDPTIIIGDISAQDVRAIVEFSYRGEVRIPVESISSLLEAAHMLKICGLMEIESLDDDTSNDCPDDTIEALVDSNESDSAWKILKHDEQDDSSEAIKPEEEVKLNSRGKKRKREYMRREYNSEMLDSAINDVRAGSSLVDAATKNNVPRSTLYMRAKALGVSMHATRHEYPIECIQAATEAVMNGASFQHASELYRIPKTVLWRKLQKENYQGLKPEMKRSYDADKREAAIKALQRGENLTKVSLEFQIPKTTLFRDKVRLVDQGKLPETFWKKRKTEDEKLKRVRLEQAVNACLSGKMSQAAAAIAFHIPKTTIWRRLQLENKRLEIRNKKVRSQLQTTRTIIKDEIECLNHSDAAVRNVSSEIPLTYIDESNAPGDSVIILTKGEVDDLNLANEQQIIVSADDHCSAYAPCTISIDDSANYETVES